MSSSWLTLPTFFRSVGLTRDPTVMCWATCSSRSRRATRSPRAWPWSSVVRRSPRQDARSQSSHRGKAAAAPCGPARRAGHESHGCGGRRDAHHCPDFGLSCCFRGTCGTPSVRSPGVSLLIGHACNDCNACNACNACKSIWSVLNGPPRDCVVCFTIESAYAGGRERLSQVRRCRL